MAINVLTSQSGAGYFNPGTQNVSFTTPSGSKKCLVVRGKGIGSATYNSLALTNSGDMWYLIDPPVGTFTLSLTTSGGLDAGYYSALVYDNVKRTSPLITTYTLTSSTSSSQNITYNTFTINGSGNLRVDVMSSYLYGTGGGQFTAPSWSGATEITAGNGNLAFSDNSQSIASIGSGNTFYTGGVGFSAILSGYPSQTVYSLNPFAILESPSSSTFASETTSPITYKSATVSVNINGNGYSNATYIEYGTVSGTYTTQLATETLGTGVNVYSKTITGLLPNTTYFWRAVSDNGNWSANGTEQSFTTLPTPTTTTSSASSITGTSATLEGFITNGNVAGTHQFQYGIATGVYTNTTTSTPNTANSSQQAISADLTGLTTGVAIFFRTVLIVDGITYNGAEMTFTPGSAPVISLEAISALTDTTVTLNGLVNPGGLATNYQFEYGTTVALGSTTALTSAGSGVGDVTINAGLTGLTQNTTYYYRLTAVNGGGTNNTSTSSFITNGDPVINSFTVADSVVYTENTFSFNVDINDTSATYQLDYGIAPSTYTEQLTGTLTSDGSTNLDVTGLPPNSTYYALLTITNSFGVVSSSEISFSTFASPFTTVWTNTDLEPTTTWTNQTI